MKRLPILASLIISIFIGFSSLAATEKVDAESGTSSSKIEKVEKVERKKIGVDQSDFMPDANSFGFIVSYSAWYNDLQQVDRKTFVHRLSLSGTYSFDKHFSAYGSVTASHESFGQNIVRENDNDDFHEISDINFGLVYSKSNPLSFISRSSNTLNIALPISEESRVNKQIGSFSLANFMQSHGWKGFSLFNRLLGNFVWNTQKFSIFDGELIGQDEMNRDWLVSNSLGVTYMIVPSVGARFNYRANMVRFLDGSWNLSFGDNLSIFANVKGMQIFASMINNSYQENERIDVGYFDKYRRIFLGGVTYAF